MGARSAGMAPSPQKPASMRWASGAR